MLLHILLFVLLVSPAFADDGNCPIFDVSPSLDERDVGITPEELPPEVKPFVQKRTCPRFLADADLNGDGLQDFILVLEKQDVTTDEYDIEGHERLLLILARKPDGSLEEVKRNGQIVYCSACGGMMGDPFMGVKADLKTFTVMHYGGSSWRWSSHYTFNYSSRDNTWQLVRAEERSFHASDPDTEKITALTPPKDYGKIDIADFDPEIFWEQHKK